MIAGLAPRLAIQRDLFFVDGFGAHSKAPAVTDDLCTSKPQQREYSTSMRCSWLEGQGRCRSEILPRVLLPPEGRSALCLKASGSNSLAGFNRAIKAADLWAPREQLTPGRARFHGALCGQSPHEELIPSRPKMSAGLGRSRVSERSSKFRTLAACITVTERTAA
jgi:hypothetical protein